MSVTINTNQASLSAQRRLQDSTDSLKISYERLSSGLRINQASDDAAGLAIATSLNADSRVYSQGIRNVNDAISLTSIAEGSVGSLEQILTRTKELAEQAANGTLTNTQRGALDKEAQSLSSEYNRIIQTTAFNTTQLLDGTFTDTTIQAEYSDLPISIGLSLARNIGSVTYLRGYGASIGNGGSVLADLDNDGNLDIADVNSAGNNLQIAYGNGDGTFKAVITRTVLNPYQKIDFYDINGDGYLDLISSGAAEKVYLSTGPGTFNSTPVQTFSNTGGQTNFADLNGDGRIDVLRSSTTETTILYGNADGSFSTGITLLHTGSNIGAQNSTVADFNGDGLQDIFVGGSTFPSSVIYLSNGNGTFSIAQTIGITAAGFTDDFNNDGILDLVTTGALSVQVLYGNGNGTFKVGQTFATNNLSINSKYLDLNGDGNKDILIGTTGGTAAIALLGNGDGSFKALTTVAIAGSNIVNLSTGDVNKDGVADFLVANLGQTRLYLGNSTTSTTLSNFNLTTKSDALEALDIISTALQRVQLEEGNIGSVQSRLQAGLANLTQARVQYENSASQILDVDVASESASLTRNQILQQAGIAILAQANLQPRIALSLLQDL